MHKAIGTVVRRANQRAFQKDSFWCAKGLVLEGKRTPFGV